jgi:transposase
MTSLTTKGRYAKARQKEKAIHLIEAGGIDVEEAFFRVGLKISRYSYPRILARYKAQGVEGLVDPRGGKRFEKLTDNIKEEIRAMREEGKALTAGQICEIIKERHAIDVHHSHMSRILARMGLNRPVGRPSGIERGEEVALDRVGSFFLKAALLAMDLPDVITQTILRAERETKKAGGRHGRDKRNILSTNPHIIRQKVETLLFMPLFDVERMWHLETKPLQRGLGFITRSKPPYKFRTMDNFLREISRLDIREPLAKTLARRYTKAFRVRFDQKEWQTFYMDSHHKLLWARERLDKERGQTNIGIPRHQDIYVIHDFRGHPLLSTACPGGSCPGKGLFSLIAMLEAALDAQAVGLSVFPCQEIPVCVIDAFIRRKRSFITGTEKTVQYRLNDFQGAEGRCWEAYKDGGGTSGEAQEILDCHKILKGGTLKKPLRVRTILVRQARAPDFFVVATNISRREEPDPGKIVETYGTQRDGHQTALKQIRPSFYIDPTTISSAPLPCTGLDVIGEDESPCNLGSPKEEILTLLEVALNNAHIFVKENYFPEPFQGLHFAAVKELLYKQPGRLIQGKRAIKIILNRYEEEPDHQALVEYAAQRVNEAGLVTAAGKRLVMAVSRSQ